MAENQAKIRGMSLVAAMAKMDSKYAKANEQKVSQLALDGNPAAQFCLAGIMRERLGDAARNSGGMDKLWFDKAVDEKFPPALFINGMMCEDLAFAPDRKMNPEQISTLKKMAYENYEKAAKLGYLPAEFDVAKCYAQGIGVPKDSVKAEELSASAREKSGVVHFGDTTFESGYVSVKSHADYYGEWIKDWHTANTSIVARISARVGGVFGRKSADKASVR
ncbi:MAG: hypothetical protein FWE53_05125 [Firmicutes bacterium]|nr:hypothetical protein [Bacillota bacterium]